MIKAVIFDIDGVLLDSFEANFKFVCALLKKHGYKAPTREAFRKLIHMTLFNMLKSLTKLDSIEELKKIWQAAADKEKYAYPHKLLNLPERLYETINELSKEYTLAIVTSRVKASVFGMPQLIPLQKYFEVVVAFEDTDDHKPHPAPLILCAKNLGIFPGECVYIGDTESDVEAARSAGMKSIRYSKETSPQADITTETFADLPSLIKSLK